MILHPFVRKVVEALPRLIAPPWDVVVAVSGGPDSVALLRALWTLSKRGWGGNVVAAHLNHQLRAEESDADEEFVVGLAKRLSAEGNAIASRCERVNVRDAASAERGNLEAVARRLRYDWLKRVAQETGLLWVATGHTADDQAETVLHRILRGTGVRGLRGIAARWPLDDRIQVIRPLLAIRKSEVLDYLKDIGQNYRHDRTNDDDALMRNRLRHHLLPMLAKQYNPSIVEALGRLAEQAGDLFAEQETNARALLAAVELPCVEGRIVLGRCTLAGRQRNAVRDVLRVIWEREAWPVGGMGFADWDRAAGVALGESPAVDLPGQVRMQSRERVVWLERGQ